jgi:hypothetical protein
VLRVYPEAERALLRDLQERRERERKVAQPLEASHRMNLNDDSMLIEVLFIMQNV